MDKQQLKSLFKEGALLTAKILPAPMMPGRYILVFGKANGREEQIIKTRSDQKKVYKRLTGAVFDAQKIGFKKVELNFE